MTARKQSGGSAESLVHTRQPTDGTAELSAAHAARMCVQRARPGQRTVDAARRGLTGFACILHAYRAAHAACTRRSTQTSSGCPVPEPRTM
jgi:hypothetical protein